VEGGCEWKIVVWERGIADVFQVLHAKGSARGIVNHNEIM
jgi:hypothetical protein